MDIPAIIKNILSNVLPEKIFELNFDNRKVEINADSVVVGDQTITDPKAVAEIIDTVFEKLGEYKGEDTLPAQLIHKDLSEGYSDYEGLSISHKESIVKLKSVLPQEEVECILAARRIKATYDRPDTELAKKYHEEFYKNYPKKGGRVYNLVGGGYFDELLIPFIDIFREKYGAKYVEEYMKFYSDTLKFFPTAVFVGNNKSEQNVESELTERLNMKGLPFVRLHAIRTNNIKKIDAVFEKLGIREDYPVNDTPFTTPGGLRAVIYEVILQIDDSGVDEETEGLCEKRVVTSN